MKAIQSFLSILTGITMMMSATNCSTAQKLQNEAPANFEDVYFQKWTGGVKGSGSGITLFIPVANASIELDSVYFRGKAAKLETKPQNKTLFIGRFETHFNQREDIILSSDPLEEAKNELPKKVESIPFELEDNECVISYKEDKKTLYFKITGITEKEQQHYPSAPSNRQ